jgi:hypothetical protein
VCCGCWWGWVSVVAVVRCCSCRCCCCYNVLVGFTLLPLLFSVLFAVNDVVNHCIAEPDHFTNTAATNLVCTILHYWLQERNVALMVPGCIKTQMGLDTYRVSLSAATDIDIALDMHTTHCLQLKNSLLLASSLEQSVAETVSQHDETRMLLNTVWSLGNTYSLSTQTSILLCHGA